MRLFGALYTTTILSIGQLNVSLLKDFLGKKFQIGGQCSVKLV